MRPTSRRLLTFVLVLVLAACGSSGADKVSSDPLKYAQVNEGPIGYTSLPYDWTSPLPKLQFEGDSLTHQAARDLYDHFHDRYNVAIEGTVGISTFEEVPHETGAEALLKPKVAVIELGTNDARRLAHPDLAAADVRMPQPAQALDQVKFRFTLLASQFPKSTCLVFVTVNTYDPSWGPAQAQAINDHFEALAKYRPNTFVADWNAAWTPEFFDHEDNPHPNARGRRAMVAVMDRAIARCHA